MWLLFVDAPPQCAGLKFLPCTACGRGCLASPPNLQQPPQVSKAVRGRPKRRSWVRRVKCPAHFCTRGWAGISDGGKGKIQVIPWPVLACRRVCGSGLRRWEGTRAPRPGGVGTLVATSPGCTAWATGSVECEAHPVSSRNFNLNVVILMSPCEFVHLICLTHHLHHIHLPYSPLCKTSARLTSLHCSVIHSCGYSLTH